MSTLDTLLNEMVAAGAGTLTAFVVGQNGLMISASTLGVSLTPDKSAQVAAVNCVDRVVAAVAQAIVSDAIGNV
jgi:hypothetical protein